MRIEEFFQQHGAESIKVLEAAPYFIRVRWDRIHGEKMIAVLNYDQIDSPRFNPICDQLRSLIVDFDEAGVPHIVSRAFDRFYNYGEGQLDSRFNIEEAVALEKVDGSLIKVYFWEGEWRISTRGTPFADTPVGNMSETTFADLFKRAIGVEFSKVTDGMSDEHTYVFELACRENRVVTRYEKDQVVLLAIVDNKTGEFCQEEIVDFVGNIMGTIANVRRPKVWKLSSFEEAVKATAELGGLQEGFVVLHEATNLRVKIKSAAYVVVHHMRGEGALTAKKIITLVLLNEHFEYIAHFPEDLEIFQPFIEALPNLLLEMELVYARERHHVVQKDFAMAVKEYPFSDVMFSARKFGRTPTEAFWAIPNQTRQIELVERKKIANENT